MTSKLNCTVGGCFETFVGKYSAVSKKSFRGNFRLDFLAIGWKLWKTSKISFLEFQLVYNSIFLKFLKQKLRKLQIADFEQNWDFLPFFHFLTISSSVLASFMLE